MAYDGDIFFGGLLWGVQQPPKKWRIQSNSFRFPTFCSFHWYEIGNGWKLDAAKLLNDQNKGFSAVNRRSAPRYFLICGLAQVKCLSQWSPSKSCFLKMHRPHSSFSWLHRPHSCGNMVRPPAMSFLELQCWLIGLYPVLADEESSWWLFWTFSIGMFWCWVFTTGKF